MNSTEKSLKLRFALYATAAQLLLAILTLISFVLAEAQSFASYPLLKLLSVLSAIYLGAVLGVSFAEARRSGPKAAFYLLLIASGADLFGGIVALLLQALLFESYLELLPFLQAIGATLETTVLPLLLLFAPAYLLYLGKDEGKEEPASLFDLSVPLTRAALAAAAAATLYKLIFQIVDTVSFLDATFGILLEGELFTIILDYLLLLLQGFLIYFFILFFQKKSDEYVLSLEEDEEDEEELTEE